MPRRTNPRSLPRGTSVDSGLRETRRRGRRALRHAELASTDACRKVPNSLLDTVARNTLADDIPPFPVVNGPLFGLSRPLASALVTDPGPSEYLRDLKLTPRVRAALSRPGGPRKSNFGCWPVGDTILGVWFTRLAVRRGLRLTLVNSPFMVQHHPWPASVHGAFSNRSIVMHGLKRERNQLKFRALAEARGLGKFIPFKRTCGACAKLGWSTWPGSPHAEWTCCGCDATRSKKTCDARMNGIADEE